MNRSFNLLDEPWLPVRLQDGRVCDLGLLGLFERSSEISTLAETAPPSLIAQYRLLLAITHRALSRVQGRWTDADRARWYQDGLPVEAIRDYLEHWRERFWLFHPQQPFMQVAALADEPETQTRFPAFSIRVDQLYGHEMFNHRVYSKEPQHPAGLLRDLLGYYQFVPGGFFPGKKLKSSDKAGPLVNTAAVLPVGKCLDKTLCLSMHPCTPPTHEDLPSWERRPPTIAELRAEPTLATGPNDRYTRVSRSVLLLPDEDGLVKEVMLAAGLALADDISAPDPMASYRFGSNNFVRLSFQEGRAFWRDLPALVPSAEGKASHPAAVLAWAANLHASISFSLVEQPLLVAGLSSDQGKLLRWRSEQIVLPAILLADPDRAEFIRTLVRQAETLFDDIRTISVGAYVDALPDIGRKESWARARSLFDSGPAAALYFASAERSLGQVMVLLGSGDLANLDKSEALWQQVLLAAAKSTWQAVREGLGRSPRAMRADAKLYPRLLARLRPLRPPENNFSITDKEA